MDKKLEDICVWKDLSNNPNSSTFSDVRCCETDHPLRKCLACPGYKVEAKEKETVYEHHICTDYVSLRSLYNLRKIL